MAECPGCAVGTIDGHIYGHGADTSDVNWRDNESAPVARVDAPQRLSLAPPDPEAIDAQNAALEEIRRAVARVKDGLDASYFTFRDLGLVLEMLDQREAELATIQAALRRWIVSRDACTGVITQEMSVEYVIAAVDEAQAAVEALAVIAREVCS